MKNNDSGRGSTIMPIHYALTSKECLENICSECELLASKQFKRCPFRSISNEHCDDYEQIERDLDLLDKYKAIEQEIGIDLITLFKVLKANDVYIKDDLSESIYKSTFILQYEKYDDEWGYCLEDGQMFKLCDYGKTWALTREELEDEQRRSI